MFVVVVIVDSRGGALELISLSSQGARAGADITSAGADIVLLSYSKGLLELISRGDGLLVGHINSDRPKVLANSKISRPLQSCIRHSTSSHWVHVTRAGSTR